MKTRMIFFFFFRNCPMTALFWYNTKSVFSSFPVSAIDDFFSGDIYESFRVGVCWFQKHKYICPFSIFMYLFTVKSTVPNENPDIFYILGLKCFFLLNGHYQNIFIFSQIMNYCMYSSLNPLGR